MPDEKIEKNTVEIEVPEQKSNDTEKLDLETLKADVGDKEFEMIQSHNLIPKDEEDDKDVEDEDTDDEEEKKEDTEKEDVDDEEPDKDPDNFEAMDKVLEKNEKKFHEIYTPNQKALYFKSKANIKKRQEAVKELLETKKQLEEAKIGLTSKSKLDKIAKALQENEDNLTIEMLQAIIDEKEAKTDNSDNSEKDKELLQKKIEQKNIYAEQIGKSKYDNFIEIANLANELYQSDRPNGIYRTAIDSAYASDNIDEDELVETIVKIAKFNPKYKDLEKGLDDSKKDKINRVIKNSKKKISSAAIKSASSKKIVNYDDLTLEDLSRLPQSTYSKIPQKVRDKILMSSEN